MSISLDDGLLGIVVWDLLYALFIVTTTMSIFVDQAQKGKLNNSLTDLITSLILAIRAIVGIRTCCKDFDTDRVRIYLIVRLSWNLALIIFNVSMAGLKKMMVTSFLTKLFVILVVDGYMNFIIFSYLSPQSDFVNKENDDEVFSEDDVAEEGNEDEENGSH
jgi:hypothetical protein